MHMVKEGLFVAHVELLVARVGLLLAHVGYW